MASQSNCFRASGLVKDDNASAESLPDRAIPTEANLVTSERLAQIDTTIDKLEQDYARATAAEEFRVGSADRRSITGCQQHRRPQLLAIANSTTNGGTPKKIARWLDGRQIPSQTNGATQ